MNPTSRDNDHLRSDDRRTDRHSPIPLIDSAHQVKIFAILGLKVFFFVGYKIKMSKK